MKIGLISNQNFKAQYQTSTKKTQNEMQEYYQGILQRQQAYIDAQTKVIKQEQQKLQYLQYGYGLIQHAKNTTLDLMKYMQDKNCLLYTSPSPRD